MTKGSTSAAVGRGRPVTINLDDTAEAFKILGSEVRLVEGRMVIGGLRSMKKEAQIYIDFVERLASAIPYKPNFTIHSQVLDRKQMQRLKDVGLDCLTLQKEVWDKELFAEVCPGKSKRDGHERYLEGLLEAVDIFGAGNVGTTFVGGLTLFPKNGHKTWQEARDSHIEGNTWTIKNGIYPMFRNVRLPQGSFYGEDKSNLAKVPPLEYYLDLIKSHHEAMVDYGLYQKLNKFMFCGFDCLQDTYGGEVGMLALAGDIGNWMAGAVAAEHNWLAQFVRSVRIARAGAEVAV